MVAKLMTSLVALAVGFTCAWFYLRGPVAAPDPRTHPFAGHRPWRRVGAAICLLIAVMYVVGIYVVDIPDRPVPYALYWLVMLGLVVWLFALAVRDVMYTRELIRRWRSDLAAETGDDRSRSHATRDRTPS